MSTGGHSTVRWQARLAYQLEQLHLVRASLLPGESFAFSLPPDSEALATWTRLLDAFAVQLELEGVEEDGLTEPPQCQARFEVRGARGVVPWFEVTLPACTTSADDVHYNVDVDDDDDDASAASSAIRTRMPTVNVKGSGHLGRATQAWWQTQIHARIDEVLVTMTGDSEDGYPVYALVTELFALLQSQSQPEPLPCSSELSSSLSSSTPGPQPHPAPAPAPAPAQTPYHALLTSHHLISPTKRRALAALAHGHAHAHALTTGFAKLGYPGIIYAQGTRDAVEAFVREVKRWQWLALRVRCVEPVIVIGTTTVPSTESSSPERWIEMTKVGEVVDWMRKRGMESLLTDLGIGAPSKASKS